MIPSREQEDRSRDNIELNAEVDALAMFLRSCLGDHVSYATVTMAQVEKSLCIQAVNDPGG